MNIDFSLYTILCPWRYSTMMTTVNPFHEFPPSLTRAESEPIAPLFPSLVRLSAVAGARYHIRSLGISLRGDVVAFQLLVHVLWAGAVWWPGLSGDDLDGFLSLISTLRFGTLSVDAMGQGLLMSLDVVANCL